MTGQTILLALLSVVLTLLLWNLRWVLLIVFGAVVVSVALDVLIAAVQRRTRLQRPQALVLVLGLLLVSAAVIGQLLIPELFEQIQQLGRDLPQLIDKISTLIGSDPRWSGLSTGMTAEWNLERLQPLGAQLLGFAGGAANSLIQVFLMALLAVLLALDPAAHQGMVLAMRWHHCCRCAASSPARGGSSWASLRPLMVLSARAALRADTSGRSPRASFLA